MDKTTSAVKTKDEKKPYEQPAIIHRQMLEAVAGVCDPDVGGREDPSVCSGILFS